MNPNRYKIIDKSNNKVKLAEDKYNSSWNLSNVTNMSKMFKNAELFNADIRLWDVGNVEDMSHMFEDAYDFKFQFNIMECIKSKKYELHV